MLRRKASNCQSQKKGKEGKRKMIASCGFLENELRQFSASMMPARTWEVHKVGMAPTERSN